MFLYCKMLSYKLCLVMSSYISREEKFKKPRDDLSVQKNVLIKLKQYILRVTNISINDNKIKVKIKICSIKM